MKLNCGGGGGKNVHTVSLTFFNEIALIHIICKCIIMYIIFKYNPIKQCSVGIEKN